MISSVTTSDRKPVALVTGGTSGIGFVACQQLGEKGYEVIFTSRSTEKGQAALAAMEGKLAEDGGSGGGISYVLMELGDLSSVKKACDELVAKKQQLDHVLLNAGLNHFASKETCFSAQNIEDTVATNHVAGTYIALRLRKLMEETSIVKHPTITFVSSDLHDLHSPTGASRKVGPPVEDKTVTFLSRQGIDGIAGTSVPYNLPKDDPHFVEFNGTWAYKYSKLLNLVAMLGLHQQSSKQQSNKIRYVAMEPGAVPASELAREVREALLGTIGYASLKWLIYNTPLRWLVSYVIGQPVRTLDEAAASEVYALTCGKGGAYYRLDEEENYAAVLKDASVLDGLWKATLDLLKAKGFGVERS